MSEIGLPVPCPPDYVASNLPPHLRQEVRRLIESIVAGGRTWWPLRMPLYLGGTPHLHGQLKRDPHDKLDTAVDRERDPLF